MRKERYASYEDLGVMSQRAGCVFGSLVLATLIAAPSAHAVCKSPKNICKHIDDCLQRTNKDADQIKEGVRTRNGKMVWAGAEACARDLGRKRQWDGWARECSDLEYLSIARVEMELGKVYCDRYSQYRASLRDGSPAVWPIILSGGWRRDPMAKERRVYKPRIVGGKVIMPADPRRLHKYMLSPALSTNRIDQFIALAARHAIP